jgi:large repetitive protein
LRRHAAVLLLGLGALLVTPGAAGEPDVPGDPTPPVVAPVISGTLGNAGWYTSNVTVNWSIVDPESIILSTTGCNAVTFTTNTIGTQLTCTAESDGGTTTVSKAFKVDKTAPASNATPSRGSDKNGWYNHELTVAFSGSDAMSGLESCSAPKVYGGPDTTSTSVSGTCKDVAGNVGQAAFPLQYDETSPQASPAARPPDSNGWYNHAVTVTFQGADGTSGVQSCTQVTYSGPDDPSTALSGTCVDFAGNQSTSSVFTLKYDETAPSNGGGSPSRGPDANGWFNHALTITFQGADATSGIQTCTQVSYSGPDNANASVSGSCRDNAGNQSGSSSFPFKYDATAPALVPDPVPDPNANGWHKAALMVRFPGSDAISGIDTCTADQAYSGPDTTGTPITGSCSDKAGNTSGAKTYTLKYDATAPLLAPTPSRAPDANGWYNHALSVSFPGTDATSGIDACTPQQNYSGPDNAEASISGTCTDKAGNPTPKAFGFQFDATAPALVPDPVPDPNANGWHREKPLTVKFPGSDAISGIDTCTADQAYSGGDTTGIPITGSCTDMAGNTSGAKTYTLKYDATAPSTTATPSRPPNANGWYNAALTVSFTGGDATSQIDSCDPAKSYSGPDIASTTLIGACRDKAGNSGSGSFTVKYDATPPQATATPDRQPNANGWYKAAVTITFAGTDTLSGLGSCPTPQNYAGPDAVLAVVSGTCLDKAGNGGLASFAVSYDQTAPVTSAVPSRQADHATWYNAPLTVAFGATDATSGTDSCSAPQGYSGPDTDSASRSGSCSDRAGNSSAKAFPFKYDATPPNVTNAVPRRLPDRAGWYNHPVEVDAQGNDATSGLAGPCASVSYSGPDGNDVPISGSCVDVAGNVGFKWFSIDYDGTGPQATATPSRAPDANGWYNQPLIVSFSGADSVSGLDSCAGPETYDGPDSAAAVVGGICIDKAGNAGVASLAVYFDATAPQITGATPKRPADANGWYNHPLVVGFHGSDATSGIDACTEATYAGPDSGAASLTGSCRDRAGNGSQGASFTLRYDTTAPSLTDVRAKAGNAKAELTWAASPDTTLVEIRRSGKLVYGGTGKSFIETRLQNGVRYGYTLTAYDEAHNVATAEVTAKPMAPLFSPAAGAKVTTPPRLVWVAAEKATHYNVQVWRKGRIFSAWPKGTSIRLKAAWTYNGRRYRLTPGRYRWYVWPGYGRPTSKKFGPLLGASSFVVKAPRR